MSRAHLKSWEWVEEESWCLDLDRSTFWPHPQKKLFTVSFTYEFNLLLSCRNDTKEDVFVHQVRFPWNWRLTPLCNEDWRCRRALCSSRAVSWTQATVSHYWVVICLWGIASRGICEDIRYKVLGGLVLVSAQLPQRCLLEVQFSCLVTLCSCWIEIKWNVELAVGREITWAVIGMQCQWRFLFLGETHRICCLRLLMKVCKHLNRHFVHLTGMCT